MSQDSKGQKSVKLEARHAAPVTLAPDVTASDVRRIVAHLLKGKLAGKGTEKA